MPWLQGGLSTETANWCCPARAATKIIKMLGGQVRRKIEGAVRAKRKKDLTSRNFCLGPGGPGLDSHCPQTSCWRSSGQTGHAREGPELHCGQPTELPKNLSVDPIQKSINYKNTLPTPWPAKDLNMRGTWKFDMPSIKFSCMDTSCRLTMCCCWYLCSMTHPCCSAHQHMALALCHVHRPPHCLLCTRMAGIHKASVK